MAEGKRDIVISSADQLLDARTRREFLRLMSIGGTAVLLPSVFASCSDDDDPVGGGGNVVLNLNNDTGILNYAYALEQLEAAFYTRVVGSFSGSGLSTAEQVIFTDIKNHEVIHREAISRLLGTARIANLTPDPTYNNTNFAMRASILTTARTFEDLGVSAYNGAGKYLASAANLLVAGKIVSVEARHAAIIRDLITPNDPRAFAGDDVVNAQGLDVVNEPSAVLTAADPYIQTPITIGSPPTP